jgi:hypothetical protein
MACGFYGSPLLKAGSAYIFTAGILHQHGIVFNSADKSGYPARALLTDVLAAIVQFPLNLWSRINYLRYI